MVGSDEYDDIGTIWWEAPLNDVNRDAVRDLNGVKEVIQQCGRNCPPDLMISSALVSRPQAIRRGNYEERNTTRGISNGTEKLGKRDSGFTFQTGADDDMVFLSAYPTLELAGLPLTTYDEKFVYDDSAGENSVIYMLDTVDHFIIVS